MYKKSGETFEYQCSQITWPSNMWYGWTGSVSLTNWVAAPTDLNYILYEFQIQPIRLQ